MIRIPRILLGIVGRGRRIGALSDVSEGLNVLIVYTVSRRLDKTLEFNFT